MLHHLSFMVAWSTMNLNSWRLLLLQQLAVCESQNRFVWVDLLVSRPMVVNENEGSECHWRRLIFNASGFEGYVFLLLVRLWLVCWYELFPHIWHSRLQAASWSSAFILTIGPMQHHTSYEYSWILPFTSVPGILILRSGISYTSFLKTQRSTIVVQHITSYPHHIWWPLRARSASGVRNAVIKAYLELLNLSSYVRLQVCFPRYLLLLTLLTEQLSCNHTAYDHLLIGENMFKSISIGLMEE